MATRTLKFYFWEKLYLFIAFLKYAVHAYLTGHLKKNRPGDSIVLYLQV